MVELKKEKKGKEAIIIDPAAVPEGACHIKKWGDGKISICKENGKIKIFEIVKEE